MDDACSVKHKNIDERFTEVFVRMEKVEDKQDLQEGAAIRNEVLVATLCKQVASLCKRIEWAGYTIVVALVGFVIWYIQQPQP